MFLYPSPFSSNPNTDTALSSTKSDPHFLGGFRNQAMRFVAFVSYAVQNNISQILLPSLRWGDVHNKGKSILHEHLFDVAFWNANAEELGIPLLVRYDPNVLEGMIEISEYENGTKSEQYYYNQDNIVPCWNTTSGLYPELDESLLRSDSINMRMVDTLAEIDSITGKYNGSHSHCGGTFRDKDPGYIAFMEHMDTKNGLAKRGLKIRRCFTHLVPYGGGLTVGRLWKGYYELQKTRKLASMTVKINKKLLNVYPEHLPVEKAIFQLLQPSDALRSAMEAAALLHSNDGKQQSTDGKAIPRILALHPRIERDMLKHKCARYMENDLATVFERIRTYPSFVDGSEHKFDLVFIALSKMQVEDMSQGITQSVVETMTNNLHTLNMARTNGLFESSIPIFESGTATASTVLFVETPLDANTETFTADQLGVNELVAMVINYFTLVRADIFVGVRGSSFSTDVFSARYYNSQTEGYVGRAKSYIVGRQGIEELFGPPPPLDCDSL
jgi:hypothetical protein